MGKSFDIATSISQQLPFFSCMNVVLSKEFQKDISKYLYCQKFNVPPFKGSYGDQSYKWIFKINIIDIAKHKMEEMARKKAEKQSNIG